MISEINVLKYIDWSCSCFICTRISMTSLYKKTGVKLESLTNNGILIMVEKGIRGGISHAIQRYAIANNKYFENYYKIIESSHLMYLDANSFYG